jgi:hypothetical protein
MSTESKSSVSEADSNEKSPELSESELETVSGGVSFSYGKIELTYKESDGSLSSPLKKL